MAQKAKDIIILIAFYATLISGAYIIINVDTLMGIALAMPAALGTGYFTAAVLLGRS